MRIVEYPYDRRLPAQITGLHFAADGRSLVAMMRLQSEVLYPCRWDLQQQAVIEADVGIGVEEDAGFAPEVAFSPDERFLAYVYIERGPELSLRLVDRSAPAKSPRRERRLTAWASHRCCQAYLALQFSPDGRTLIAAVVNTAEEEDASDDAATGIYHWSVARVVRNRGSKYEGHLLPDRGYLPLANPDVQAVYGLGKSLTFAPDGSTLAAGLWKDRVLCLEFPSGKGRPTPAVGTRRNLGGWPLAFSPDGGALAVADETVTLYEAGTGDQRVVLPAGPAVRVFRASRPVVRDLAFDPTGRILATANGDPVVRWWDGATGSPLRSFDWGIGPVAAVAFSPDGCLCAAAGERGRVAVWDVID
jgi:WD40 repeat protein